MHDFAPATPEWALPYPSQRMPTLARRGIVATSQVLAAQAGTEVLARGGNAVDAAIATAACMTVLEPTTNGIGGDAFALVWSPVDGGRLHGFNGSGRTPRALDRSRYGGTTMPTRGWDAVTVPGQVALWADLHRNFGALPFAVLMEPAVTYARDGYPVAVQTARLWERAASALSGNAEWRRTFTIGGRAPRAGECIRLPDHARTLERIGASLHDQARLDARELFGERKAAEEAALLHARHAVDLLGPAHGQHGAEAQIVVHGESDPKAGAVVDRVAAEEAVGTEEAVRTVAEIGVLE